MGASDRGGTALPLRRFLIMFSGHQGSSALADMLGSDPAVFIPGFEPLDFPGLAAADKTAFLEAAFTWPADAARFDRWRQEILRGKRIDRARVASFDLLAGKTVSGFKMRPYTLEATNGSSSGPGGSADRSRMHTAASGLSPAALHALLLRYNVSVVLTLRRNRLKEAMSWYKARAMGVHQFNNHSKAAAAAAAAAAASTALPALGDAGESRQVHSGQHSPQQAAEEAPPLGGRPVVNVTKLLGWLRYADQANSALRQAVAACGRPVLTVWYEDFLADPLGQARAAAAFVGVPGGGVGVRLSTKYRKAGPDAVEDAVGNYQELCEALAGTEYQQYLNASACQPPQPASLPSPASAGPLRHEADSAQQLATTSSSGSTAGAGSTSPEPPPPALLPSWCSQHDRAATGWAALSDAECMLRFAAVQAAAVAAVRAGTGTLLFKHVHKAGGSTLCRLASLNMRAEVAPLPQRSDWDTNCVPYEAFLGPHPAVGGGGALAGGGGGALAAASGAARSVLAANWLGGACWLAFLTPHQLRALPHHFRPLTFVASEGPLPDAVPLDAPLAWATMLRHPLDRVLSSYRWWQFMAQRWPQAPAECRAYDAPANATLEQWLEAYPANWMTRELVGRTALYGRRRLTDADLLLAQQRLHLFAAVLLLEAPGSSMALLQALFGWRQVGWDASRAGSRHSSDAAAELEPRLLQRLQRRNELDLQLYSYARALHAAQLRGAGLQPPWEGGGT